ncbi:iron chelate uptake ABC transporter family permease subunit [Candidatus Parabeggiatoa sp. HSG14]|uniref:FecCD family ABC transporter permease n=1 Tax=Candidatus Parabeggiatoa sp. HSG14 TaxID=3055593 RepID=UPI0025A860D9|nr:iron chelate uptake ABC transporter family permease subunit [Thiotrichales bacterium HSG14]
MNSHRPKIYFFFLSFLLILSSILGIAIGSTDIPIDVVLRVLASKILPTSWIPMDDVSKPQEVIVWLIRTPRVIIAALVGAALAMAGAQMQGLFQNPLASPGIIGTSSGAALGAVIGLATGLASRSIFYIPIFAFMGAFLAVFIVYVLATRRGNTPVATLLLAGVALNALIGAMTSFVITIAWTEYEVAREIVFWLMGGLDSRTWLHVWIALPGILIGSIIALFYTRELDILLMGQETAYSLGVEVEQVKRVILTGSALLTGAAVAVSGVIGFVGLIIPHIVRLMIGPRHRYLIPACAFTGATFLILADLLARTLHRPEEIRLGILTALFGAPFFLFLLLRHRREIGYL